VLVFHHGTPGSGSGYRIVEEPAHERGLRVVWMSRPGYGDSSRQPGRSVVDVVPDTAEVLDALGVHTCSVGGGSSDGPHALACAAHLDPAKAVLVVSMVGIVCHLAAGFLYLLMASGAATAMMITTHSSV
jgi:pimeloyl-ACP methyl ester carboxylesterase